MFSSDQDSQAAILLLGLHYYAMLCVQYKRQQVENNTEEDEFIQRSDSAASSRGSNRRQNNEDKRGFILVELEKKEGSGLGLVISGGIDKDDRPRVAHLRPGSIAHRSDVIEIGDYIVAVNGIRTSMLRHEEIANLLKNSNQSVTLELEYELPDPPQSTFSVLCKRVEVHLDKEDGSFGFTVRGGFNLDPTKCRPLTVTQIRPGSAADREGTLQIGDRLLAINGVNVTQMSLGDAGTMLKHSESIKLFVEYDVSVMEAVQNSSGPLLVEIDNTPGSNLGLTLTKTTHQKKPVHCIQNIKQASVADRCGALHVGDQVLGIDDMPIDHMTIQEAMQLLKRTSGERITLEILPACQLKTKKGLENTNTLLPPKVPNGNNLSYQSYSSHDSCSSLNSLRPYCGSAVGVPSKPQPPKSGAATWGGRHEAKDRKQSNNSLSSSGASSMVPSNHVCHVETTEVLLVADFRGFGMKLQGPTLSSEVLIEPPVIGALEPNGIADKCGILQEGDRVIAINGQYLEHRTLEEANEMIGAAGMKLSLLVEFDVADSIVPSSGIFNVKMPKKGGGLGITINSPSNRKPGDPLIISDIRKGSVSHRTGTIQPGDKLLAIDDIRLDNCTIEDAAQILENTGDVVKLRIRKDEAFAEEPDPSTAILYTVELQRFGGPLGITISGTDDPFDPIFISGLNEGGLAEKTGALRIGDRILAINGESLRGKTLPDAIELLQCAGETVNLKITRPSTEKSRSGVTGKPGEYDNDTPVQSVDSALESWDSSGFDNKKALGNGDDLSLTKSHSINSQWEDDQNLDDTDLPPPPHHLLHPDSPKQPNGHIPNMKQQSSHIPSPHSTPPISIHNSRNSLAHSQEKILHSTPSSNSCHTTGLHNATVHTNGPPPAVPSTGNKTCSLHVVTDTLGMEVQQAKCKSLDDMLYIHETNVDSALEGACGGETDTCKRQPKSQKMNVERAMHMLNQNVQSLNSLNSDTKEDVANPKSSGTYSDLNSELRLFSHEWTPSHSLGEEADSLGSLERPPEDDYWSKALEDLDNLSDVSGSPDTPNTTLQKVPNLERRRHSASEALPDMGSLRKSKSKSAADKLESSAEMHLKEVEEQLENIFTPTPVELNRVTLYKLRDNDFGFCLSDGVYEKGVYISAIRPGGPAQSCGNLRPYDRVLQVNNVRTKDMDCHQVVPLIAQAGNTLDLVISRNPLAFRKPSAKDTEEKQVWQPRRRDEFEINDIEYTSREFAW